MYQNCPLRAVFAINKWLQNTHSYAALTSGSTSSSSSSSVSVAEIKDADCIFPIYSSRIKITPLG